jgi:hypothetical protein
LGQIGPLKNTKKGFDRSVDRSVELGLGFCYQQSGYGGGSLAEGRRQRDVARVAPIAGIARHRRDRKSKPLTTKDTKERKGEGKRNFADFAGTGESG